MLFWPDDSTHENNYKCSDTKYHFFGDLYLDDPRKWLSKQDLDRLLDLEPLLKEFQSRTKAQQCSRTGPQNRDYLGPFEALKATEPFLFNPPRAAEELCHPSGDLKAKLAVHLHNPSFTTFDTRNPETADVTNPCIWLLMQSGICTGNALIFDHLARRDNIDGLQSYPQDVIQRHEHFVTWLRDHMGAIVEIVCGGVIRKRYELDTELEPVHLWGEYANAPLFIEWEKVMNTSQTDECPTLPVHRENRIKRFILFGYHPQAFLFVWGPRQYGKAQDLVIQIASKLTRTTLKTKYFSTLRHITKSQHTRLAYEATHQLTQDQHSEFIPATAPETPLLSIAPLPLIESTKATSTLVIPEAPQSMRISKAVSLQAVSQKPLDIMTRVSLPMLDSDEKVETLRRTSRGNPKATQSWKRLVRNSSESEDLPKQVEIWCQQCKEDTVISHRSPYNKGETWPIDSNPAWTKGEPAKYIEAKPKCLACSQGKLWPWKRFIPVDPSIVSIDADGLRRVGRDHSYMSTDAAVRSLAARPTMTRERWIQQKPGLATAAGSLSRSGKVKKRRKPRNPHKLSLWKSNFSD